MCILLKLDYAKYGVSNLFFLQKLSKKPLGGRLDTPLGKGRVNPIRHGGGDDGPKMFLTTVLKHLGGES